MFVSFCSFFSEKGDNTKELNVRKAILLQWKEKKMKMKLIQQKKKQTPFVVGVVHHRINSPVFRDVSNVNTDNKIIKSQNKKSPIKQFPFKSHTSTKKPAPVCILFCFIFFNAVT